ncbi:8842_t:CDS:2 [Paraglomus occultum]|uniref:8842_t:CDS:1 n=1 Tax=Paraglomus occultum TaxID=144539 RepID=A0A9N9CHH0_9GLOM|nr:8842_t:CDS:2 [Paraglomus occultum]
MPDGSALLTNTGNNSSLKNQGINYIIHTVPRHRDSSASDEEFVEIAVKAVQNSIILADREKINKLAICFVAGKIYRGTCNPEKLAEGIVCDGDETIFDALVFNPKGNRNIIVKAGDICDKSTHGAEAIVNSENAGMN